jgi:carboxyl-terminal processing protease
MIRYLTIASVFLALFAAGGVHGQAPAHAASLPAPAQPFRIARGSSFTASRSPGDDSVAPSSSNPPVKAIVSDYAEALEIIRSNHIAGRTADQKKLTHLAIDSALQTLDPHSSYFDSHEFQELLDEQQSEYFGIGATIVNYGRADDLDTYVIATSPGSPASRSGLRFGDRIIAVDGQNVRGRSSEQVRDLVRGPHGTLVTLTLEDAADRSRTVQIRRAGVTQSSVPDAYILGSGVGYVDMTVGFAMDTASELSRALRSLHTQGARSVVLDLRGNPGGLLNQAVKAASLFLPSDRLVVTQRGRSAVDNREWRSSNPMPESAPLVVLVDGDSASASEVLAGALQDHDRAVIVGQKTFGKGLVQSVMDLPSGSGLTLTTARYYTPTGRSIQRDYSDGSLYDYYSRKMPAGGSQSTYSARTPTDRRVYGGDGITPDVETKGAHVTREQLPLIDALFFFCRRNVGSKGNSNATASFEDFRRAVQSEAITGLGTEQVDAERAFIELQLAYFNEIARGGVKAANRAVIAKDDQVARAVRAIPEAERLYLAARSIRNKKAR